MQEDPEYDTAFCVFDRDQHEKFGDALYMISNSELGKSGRMQAITSVPCFEIWLLLHYRYTSKSYSASRGESACARVIRDLQQHFEGYEKGYKTVFEKMAPMLDQALVHAERLEKYNGETKSSNPATLVHHLITYLRNLKTT
jgi:hypothetical protein